MSDKQSVFLFFAIIVLIPMALGFAIDIWGQQNTCIQKYEQLNPRWGYWSGCQIEYNGQRIPADALRIGGGM